MVVAERYEQGEKREEEQVVGQEEKTKRKIEGDAYWRGREKVIYRYNKENNKGCENLLPSVDVDFLKFAKP